MNAIRDQLPITATIQPDDQQAVIDALDDAYQSDTPIYPVGGGTSLAFGLPAKRHGRALSLGRLNRIIDYPARDMTITVEAGIRMESLADVLQAEGQRLPVDVPDAQLATLGGVIATNWNGPRRYGYGNLRDYVIGISAVDGRANLFKGGGRVVKNVAGYDFCKLLTGSFGILGVITQVTLKLKPVVERLVLMACELPDLDSCESCLSNLVHSQTTPSAIELLGGPFWHENPVLSPPTTISSKGTMQLVVALEGTHAEVDWMEKQLAKEWQEQGIETTRPIAQQQANDVWQRLIEFSAAEAPLTIKVNIVPSGTTRIIAAARQIDQECSIQAHAGNGVVIVRFFEFPSAGLCRTLIGRLQPLANSLHGNIVVLSNPSGSEMTHQSTWDGMNAPFFLMKKVKQQFDPKDLLNPGRFVV